MDFDRLAKADPKWYMGYSDNTNMTYLLATLADTASIYGPCAGAFGMELWHPAISDAFHLLTGRTQTVSGYPLWEKEALKDETNPLAPYHVTEPRVLRCYGTEYAQRTDGTTHLYNYQLNSDPQLAGGNLQTGAVSPASAPSFHVSGRLLGGCMDCLVNLTGTRFDKTKDFIERFKGTYSKTLQVQSRVKMLEKLEILEVDEEDTSALRLKFPPSPRSGSYPVTIENVSKSYGDHTVFRNANLTIERGDKIAFVGKNGEGKSTLVKCIMKELEHDGTLTIGHNVMIGYFAQNQASLLDENLTVFQTIDDVAKGDIRNKIKDLLGAFMFGGENSAKKVKVLSGGERTRLAMIKLLLEPVNLLILDEPTNHLDMKTKDILKQALMDFDGTLIVVSHDRDFLDGLVTKVYEFGNKKVTEHLEGIYEFLQRKKMENLNELERKN